MSKLVILITARLEDGHRVGEAWRDAGAPGVTFVESYGLRRMQAASGSQEVLPGMMSMLEILRQQEETSLIVLSLVEDDTVADQLLHITEAMLGDMLLPNAGVVFVVDVARALGIRDHGKDKS